MRLFGIKTTGLSASDHICSTYDLLQTPEIPLLPKRVLYTLLSDCLCSGDRIVSELTLTGRAIDVRNKVIDIGTVIEELTALSSELTKIADIYAAMFPPPLHDRRPTRPQPIPSAQWQLAIVRMRNLSGQMATMRVNTYYGPYTSWPEFKEND